MDGWQVAKLTGFPKNAGTKGNVLPREDESLTPRLILFVSHLQPLVLDHSSPLKQGRFSWGLH